MVIAALLTMPLLVPVYFGGYFLTGVMPLVIVLLAGERRLERDDMLRVLALIALFSLVVLLSWFPFAPVGYEPLNALFEVV